MNLPQVYLSNMKELLKDKYDDYLACFNSPRYYSLRVNTSKISVEDFLKISPFKLEPVAWCKDSFYYDENIRPAKHPYYYAGLYYLQEPSAALPAEVLEINEGDKVLDACAAPGGKSCKLANKLNNTGVLFSNDISVSRSQVLLKNLENFGFKNYFVISEDTNKLKDHFKNYFDKILLDAPCSGEGMFRKEPELIKSWLEKGNDYYANIQKQIIKDCLDMLKPGGKMVYSTCTFSIKEDEEIIEYAMSLYPELKILPIKKCEGMADGLTAKTKDCARMYPHLIKGEGHFVAYLQKGDEKENIQYKTIVSLKPNLDFFKNISMSFSNGTYNNRQGKLYYEPNTNHNLQGLRILRSGLYLGEYKHDKFEPSQALALALNQNEYPNIINLKCDDPRTIKYLKCETLDVKEFNIEGYTLVCVDNYPLGFGIIKNGILKNKYPANYRYQ